MKSVTLCLRRSKGVRRLFFSLPCQPQAMLPLIGEWEVWAQDVCAWLILLSHSVIEALICWRHQQSQVQKSHPLGNDQTPTRHSHSSVGVKILGVFFPLMEGSDLCFWGEKPIPVVFGAGPEEGPELICGVWCSVWAERVGSVDSGPGQGQPHCCNPDPCSVAHRNLVTGGRGITRFCIRFRLLELSKTQHTHSVQQVGIQ